MTAVEIMRACLLHKPSFVIMLLTRNGGPGQLSSQVVVDILLEAKRLLKQGWCQGTFARDGHGNPVPVMDSRAVSFDATGAITRACLDRGYPWQVGLDPVREAIDEPMSVWQDHATLPEILACIDETIATVRARHY